MVIRRITSILLYVLLFFGAIAGCSVLTGSFGGGAQSVPDYSGMQKSAEYFTRLYLDWEAPLEDRVKKMDEIAPSVSTYLVAGKQSVQYVEAETPYFSGGRGYVDVLAITKAVSKGEKENKEITRRYKLTVYFVPDGSGHYVVERMPLISLLPQQANPRPVMSKEQEVVAASVKPALEVFLPALLSGDLSSVQTMLLDDSEIVTYHGEYEYFGIEDIRIREPSNLRAADHAVDVVLEVRDVQLDQVLFIQVYLWMKENSNKFYIVRANV